MTCLIQAFFEVPRHKLLISVSSVGVLGLIFAIYTLWSKSMINKMSEHDKIILLIEIILIMMMVHAYIPSSFTSQVFMNPLRCARHCSKCLAVNEASKIPALLQPALGQVVGGQKINNSIINK